MEQDDPAAYARAKLDANGIIAKVLDTLNREPRVRRPTRVPSSPKRPFENGTPIRALLATPGEPIVAGLDQREASATRMRLPLGR
jgi:hypothetical protein